MEKVGGKSGRVASVTNSLYPGPSVEEVAQVSHHKSLDSMKLYNRLNAGSYFEAALKQAEKTKANKAAVLIGDTVYTGTGASSFHFSSSPLLPNDISTSASSGLNDVDVMPNKRHKSLHASASTSEQSVSSDICNIDLVVKENCVSIDNDKSFSDDDQNDLYPLSQVSIFSYSRPVIRGNNIPSSRI